jgi:hypothetical protein
MRRTMTPEQRRNQEEWEKARRMQVLNRIKAQKHKKDGNKVHTVSKIGYVMGRYNSVDATYQYWDSGRWADHLDRNISVASSLDELKTTGHPKGFRYCISKVFYRIVSVSNDMGSCTSYVDGIKLTKPNHYETLSAIVNHI